jgi:SAM-dependent methyltransferase
VSERPGLRFGRVAEEYERVRPGYPPALIEKALSPASLGAGAWVVEIGCGTGKLTRDLVERGLRVEAIEPDADLIAVARRILPEGSVRFHDSTLEEIELAGSYPAVFAATSFHWIDPAVGWQKVAGMLEPGGLFALVSHVGGLRDDVDRELLRVWDEVVPESVERWQPVDDETLWREAPRKMGNVSELWSWLTSHDLARPEAAELYGDVRLEREPVELALSAEEYLARLRTSNYYLHLSSDRQRRLDEALAAVIRAHGGVYRSRSFATLVTARRAG